MNRNLKTHKIMTVVSSKDLIYTPVGNRSEQPILEPDDDLRRAITMDELRERTYEVIDKFFANK